MFVPSRLFASARLLKPQVGSKMAQDGPKSGPGEAHDGSKSAPERPKRITMIIVNIIIVVQRIGSDHYRIDFQGALLQL